MSLYEYENHTTPGRYCGSTNSHRPHSYKFHGTRVHCNGAYVRKGVVYERSWHPHNKPDPKRDRVLVGPTAKRAFGARIKKRGW